MVTLEGVSFTIDGVSILEDVSAVIPSGTVTGLLGPNGAGKSTLLRLIAGLEKPDAGAVRLGGTVVASLPRREAARRIALLEQSASPSVDLSALQVVLLGRIPHRSRVLGNFGGDDDRRIAEHSLAMVGADGLAERQWHTLSGGQQQRVQIARALAQSPSLLLLDEPTNHLDVSAQLSLLGQVRDLGLTSVMALHDLNLAAAYCDHILLLHEGRLVASGTPTEVLRPSTIADVYAVDCDIIEHPRGGHPVIVFSPAGAPQPDASPLPGAPRTSRQAAPRVATKGPMNASQGAFSGNSRANSRPTAEADAPPTDQQGA